MRHTYYRYATASVDPINWRRVSRQSRRSFLSSRESVAARFSRCLIQLSAYDSQIIYDLGDWQLLGQRHVGDERCDAARKWGAAYI